jgi:hypothetical protein
LDLSPGAQFLIQQILANPAAKRITRDEPRLAFLLQPFPGQDTTCLHDVLTQFRDGTKAQVALKDLEKRVYKLQEELERMLTLTVEEEVSELLQLETQERTRQIVRDYLFIPDASLTQVGACFGLSPERIRQICERFQDRLRKRTLFLPRFDQSVSQVEAMLPCSVPEAVQRLETQGLIKEATTLKMISFWGTFLGRLIVFSIEDQLVVRGQTGEGQTAQRVLKTARNLCLRFGTAQMAQVVSACSQTHPVDAGLVARLLGDQLVWLNPEWFCLKSVFCIALVNQTKKALCVQDGLPIDLLYHQLSRNPYIKNIIPSQPLFGPLCQHMGFRVQEAKVYRTTDLPEAEILSPVELAIAIELRKMGGAAHRRELAPLVMQQGFSLCSFQNCVAWTPIVQSLKYRQGVYCLLGCAENSKLPSEMKTGGRLLESCQATESQVVLVYRLSPYVLGGGTLILPAFALSKLLGKAFTCATTVATRSFHITSRNLWGIGALIQVGYPETARLQLTFDLVRNQLSCGLLAVATDDPKQPLPSLAA